MVKSWTATYGQRYRVAYMLPGIMSWAIVVTTLFATLAIPRAWIVITSLFMCYFVGRMLVMVTFYLIGRAKVRAWERTDWATSDLLPGPAGFAPSEVFHVVIVPTYKEPIEILNRTFEALAIQHRAHERIIAVLATEEREQGVSDKGDALAARYRGRFKEFIVTAHPADLPDEIPGKAGNMSWAAREVHRCLLELGIAIDRTTVTSCDADSVMHPKYFEALSHLFAHDERRHAHFWQAPLYYDNNLWHVPAPTRITSWIAHAGQLADLTMPFYDPLPISTYTLSFRTIVESGLWDPMVISEDWHVYLNVMFERKGDVGMVPIFLPTKGDAVDGGGFFSGLKARHEQVMRHSWGAEDAGFVLGRMLQERVWNSQITFRFFQVLHDHVFRCAGWFLIVSTYVLLPHTQPLFAHDLTRTVLVHPGVWFIEELFVTGAFLLVATVLFELARTPPPSTRTPLGVVGELLAAWITLPLIGFYLGTLPALRAQTRLMLGLPFYFKVTEKRVVQEAPA